MQMAEMAGNVAGIAAGGDFIMSSPEL